MHAMLTHRRNTELYVASRSVFMLAQTYMPRRLAGIFGKTNNGHTPLAAILLCSAFGFISLSGLSRHAYNQVTETISNAYILLRYSKTRAPLSGYIPL